MGCIITFKFAGKKFSYETKLSEDKINLQSIANEICGKKGKKDKIVNYYTTDSGKTTEGYLPSVFSEYYLTRKPEDSLKVQLTKALENGEELIGNSSLNELSELFPSCNFAGLKLNENEDILFVKNFDYYGVGIGGQVKIGDRYFFVVKNGYDAKILEQYLSVRQKIDEKKELNLSGKTKVQSALNAIKKKENIKSDKTALKHFFDNSSQYLHLLSEDKVDVYSTLYNYIQKEFQQEYVREYDNQFINSVVTQSKQDKFKHYISEKRLIEIMKEFGIIAEDEKNPKVIDEIVTYFGENGYPIEARRTKTKSIEFTFKYRTFSDIGLPAMEKLELAVEANKSKEPASQQRNDFGYKIYKYGNKYYVSSNTIITKDTKANQFDSYEEARAYLDNKFKKSSIINNIHRDRIGLETSDKIFKFRTMFGGLSENSVFEGILNYNIPLNSKLESKSEFLNSLMKGSINNLIDTFKEQFGYDLSGVITSYEKAAIFIIELSKDSFFDKRFSGEVVITNETIENAKSVVEGLKTKNFHVVKYLFEKNYLIEEVPDEKIIVWEGEKKLATPIIVPLKSLAEQINSKYKKNTKSERDLVKIITVSDFKELKLPKEINQDAKGFIYNGTIYINATTANLNDLSHELGHLMLGMVKAHNMNAYMQLVNKLSTMSEIKVRMGRKRNLDEYKFLAEEDLIEEVFVDLFGEYIVRNNKDLGIIGNSVNKTLSEAVESFGSSLIGLNTLQDLFRNFNTSMKDFLFSGNGLELDESLALRRKATNFISEEIKKENIEMNC